MKIIKLLSIALSKKKAKIVLIIAVVIGIVSLFAFISSIFSIVYFLTNASSIGPYYSLTLLITILYGVISSSIIYMISFYLAKKLWKKVF